MNLPTSPIGKNSWPWESSKKQTFLQIPQRCIWPKISIITPSFNQATYLEVTIRSVLLQEYPNLEYIIIDGGSTDGSVEIIKKYEQHIDFWVSEKDEGQSNALNKGFKIASGEIVGWINSDDFYSEGALDRVAKQFISIPETTWVSGVVRHFYENDSSRVKDLFPTPSDDLLDWLTLKASIQQPGTFWRKGLFEKIGYLNEELNFCMDWEFWCRLVKIGYQPLCLNHILAWFRMHPFSKTVKDQLAFRKENDMVIKEVMATLPEDSQSILHNFMKERGIHSIIRESRFLAHNKDPIRGMFKLWSGIFTHPSILRNLETRRAILTINPIYVLWRRIDEKNRKHIKTFLQRVYRKFRIWN